jgi:hypothetical protein
VVKDAAVATVATAATEGIAVDMAAVSSAAGPRWCFLWRPLAAIGFGLYQESKLMKADAEAISDRARDA